MHDIGEGTIRRIDWQELTPVVLLLRIFNVSLGLRTMLPALIGTLLTLGILVLSGGNLMQHHIGMSGSGITAIRYLTIPGSIRFDSSAFITVAGIYLVWTVFGSMICRTVAVRLTIDESESLPNQFRFFVQRASSLISFAVLLILGILCCLLPVKIAGWLASIPYLDYVMALTLPIPLLFAFFAAVLAVGLVFGWMLMFAAVCVDGADGFDAISRMFSYLYQRPLHYLFYWLYCMILGCVGYAVVALFFNAVLYLTLSLCNFPLQDTLTARCWLFLIIILPTAYCFSWFWTSSIAIYLLLRRSVDATPFNEIYRVKEVQTKTLRTIV
ncbi:hypothetical protein FACS1894170_07460 [Planctomycetales bacterium]|nr:hypothetical protein FACS1894170_07460 [Planctomycetales bacterium]